jgi:hypothetical protein
MSDHLQIRFADISTRFSMEASDIERIGRRGAVIATRASHWRNFSGG